MRGTESGSRRRDKVSGLMKLLTGVSILLEDKFIMESIDIT